MNKIINPGIVLKLISRIFFIITAALLVCAGVAIYFSEETAPFIFSSLIALTFGGLFHLKTRKEIGDIIINRKDAYLSVTLSWFLIGLIGCLPYIFSGAIPNFINALFESVSGFTTTGSSILMDIESLPKSILFWRSLTHWIGGIGIIVLVIVIMPAFQIGGYHLFTLESSLQEKIQPRIKAVGSRILLIYIILTIAQIIFLLIGKMNFFESVCHAFGTISTGGFSPKNTSISDYSPYIQYIIMVFMILAGCNFVIHYYILKRDFKKIRNNEELKFYLWLILIIGLLLTASLFMRMDKSLEESFREAFFQVISIITCTGYASADYLLWPEFAWIIIFLAMFLGGSTGSTAGGIKMARHLILLKNIGKSFRQLIFPNTISPIRLNKNIIATDLNSSILTFISSYFLIFLIGSLSLVLIGIDSKTAFSSVASCMANIGPGIGTIGPAGNFNHIPDSGKLILTFLMLVGRLEIYTVIVLFSRNFWRI